MGLAMWFTLFWLGWPLARRVGMVTRMMRIVRYRARQNSLPKRPLVARFWDSFWAG